MASPTFASVIPVLSLLRKHQGCGFLGESENGFVILDHMDSSLAQKRKPIFLYLNRAPNIHCVRSVGDLQNIAGSLFFIIEEILDCNIELQQCLQSSNDDEAILFLSDGIPVGRKPKLF